MRVAENETVLILVTNNHYSPIPWLHHHSRFRENDDIAVFELNFRTIHLGRRKNMAALLILCSYAPSKLV